MSCSSVFLRRLLRDKQVLQGGRCHACDYIYESVNYGVVYLVIYYFYTASTFVCMGPTG